MLIQKEQELSEIQAEVFNILVSYDVEEKNRRKQHASRRLLEARRAIERRQEEKALSPYLDEESWFDDEV